MTEEIKIKSHVLRREEKGFAGIPFKRLMMAAMGGAMVYMITSSTGTLSMVLSGVSGLLVIVLTTPGGGLPLWQRLWYAIRARLMLTSFGQPTGLTARISQWLGLPVNQIEIDGNQVFRAEAEVQLTRIEDWQFFTHGTGLTFAPPPSVVVSRQTKVSQS